jgi:hypothetical protein
VKPFRGNLRGNDPSIDRHHNQQACVNGDEEGHRQNIAHIEVAANISVRIHEDFFNSHPCSRQLSEKVRTAQILSGLLPTQNWL